MFITAEEYGKLDLDMLNAVAERIHNKAVEDTLCMLPEIILGLIIKTKETQQALDTFYKDYPGLKDRAADIAEAVQACEFSKPTASLTELLEEAAKVLANAEDIPAEQPSTKEDIERTANGFL